MYLTDGEARELQSFCEENTCTQYSALKMAVKELLHRETFERPDSEQEEEIEPEENLMENENQETNVEKDTPINITKGEYNSKLLRLLLKKDR